MNAIFKKLSKQAMDYAIEQYGPQRKGEQVWNPDVYDQKYAELIVLECIKIAHDVPDYSCDTVGNHLVDFWFGDEQS